MFNDQRSRCLLQYLSASPYLCCKSIRQQRIHTSWHHKKYAEETNNTESKSKYILWVSCRCIIAWKSMENLPGKCIHSSLSCLGVRSLLFPILCSAEKPTLFRPVKLWRLYNGRIMKMLFLQEIQAWVYNRTVVQYCRVMPSSMLFSLFLFLSKSIASEIIFIL